MAATRRRFAEGTDVPVERSRGEITGILTAHGVKRQAWASEPEGDTLQFELAGYNYRFRIARPTVDEVRADYRARGHDWTRVYDPAAKVAAEWRRRWRANVLLLKAKLEFADGEASTVIRELMPYALLTTGQTLEEAITSGDSDIALLPAKASGRSQ
jgi:hypothetical protein